MQNSSGKDFLEKSYNLVVIALLLYIASKIDTLIARFFVILILSILLYLISMSVNCFVFKGDDIILLIEEWKKTNDLQEKIVNLITLSLVPIVQTIIIILIDCFMFRVI